MSPKNGKVRDKKEIGCSITGNFDSIVGSVIVSKKFMISYWHSGGTVEARESFGIFCLWEVRGTLPLAPICEIKKEDQIKDFQWSGMTNSL